MKKLKYIVLILIAFLAMPFGVFAEENSTDQETAKSEVKLYLFYGDGCTFCQNAKTWLEEIEAEHGHKFEVVKYEVWYNKTNNELMSEVAEVRKENQTGVPYIIVGNQSWDGFSEEFKSAIIAKIDSEYALDEDERYDMMNYVTTKGVADGEVVEDEGSANDILALLIILGVGGSIVAGIVYARKNAN